jgi:hypothetical protein
MPYDKAKLGRYLGIGIVSLAVVLLTISILQVNRHPRTDDATVRANSIAFAPEVEGRVVKLSVQDMRWRRRRPIKRHWRGRLRTRRDTLRWNRALWELPPQA